MSGTHTTAILAGSSKKRKSSRTSASESSTTSKRSKSKTSKASKAITLPTIAPPIITTPPAPPRTTSGRSKHRAPSSASVYGEAPDPGTAETSSATAANVGASGVFITGTGTGASTAPLHQSILSSSQGTLGISSQITPQPAGFSSITDACGAGTVPEFFDDAEEEDDDNFSGFSVSPPQGGTADELEHFRAEMRGQQEQALRDQREQFSLFQSQLFQQIQNIYRAQPPVQPVQQAPHFELPTVQQAPQFALPAVVQQAPQFALPAVEAPLPYPAIEYPGWEDEEYDYADYGEDDDGSSEFLEEPRLPTSNSNSLSISEVRATLEVLRDTLGLTVTAASEPQTPGSLTTISSFSPPSTSLAFPVDPEVVARAEAIACGPLRPKPPGAALTVLPSETAPVASSTPIPSDVWDRLIAFKKAKVASAGTGPQRPGARKCSLVDKVAADTEANLTWMGEAAKYGIEASSFMLYIVEWLLRAEKGLIIPAPANPVRLLMLSTLAKLQRRSLDQHLRVSLQAVNLRRNLILPLCGIPEVAMQRFQSLTLVGDDLFAGVFQQTIANEAERRDALQKTTFTEGSPAGRAGRPFRGYPRGRGGHTTFSAGSYSNRTRGRGRYQRQTHQPSSYRRPYGSRRATGRSSQSYRPFRRSGRGGRR